MKHVDYYLRLVIDKMDSPNVIVDATAGNGHDTLRLALMFPEADIFAFDIQKSAVENTKILLGENGVENARVILDSHENIPYHVPESIDLIVFNLGYLPGSDKMIHTDHRHTINALNNCMSLLSNGGLVVITSYPGSIRGEIEDIALRSHISKLRQSEWDVSRIEMINQMKKPPVLYVIHKK